MVRRLLVCAILGWAVIQGLPMLVAQEASPAYPGVETDAAWRDKASERIERSRKADLLVSVKDATGRPVKDAEVTVHQQMHAFHFGSIVRPELIAETEGASQFSEEDRQHYRQVVIDLFNVVIPPTEASKEQAAAVKTWAASHGFVSAMEKDAGTDIPSQFDASHLIPPEELWTLIQKLAHDKKVKKLRARAFRFIADATDPVASQLQADFTRDYLTILFSEPRVSEILFDGFWQSPGAETGWALYDEKWQLRPAGEIVTRLIKKIWWTDDSALTNAAGRCSIRCFLGEHRVSVSAAGKMKTVNATVDSAGAKITVTLD